MSANNPPSIYGRSLRELPSVLAAGETIAAVSPVCDNDPTGQAAWIAVFDLIWARLHTLLVVRAQATIAVLSSLTGSGEYFNVQARNGQLGCHPPFEVLSGS
jgi:hypothetical protein